MTAVDHAELKRLAEGATPGPWYRGHNENGVAQGEMSVWPDAKMIGGMISMTGHQAPWDGWFEQPAKDAAFIAAANPAVVLDLLSEIEGLKAAEALLKERIIDAADLFGVPDGGRYLNDWKATAAKYDALRTQAPDSWRPTEQEVETVLRCCDSMERSVERKGLPKSEADICVATDWLRKVCAALRPQTAESGK